MKSSEPSNEIDDYVRLCFFVDMAKAIARSNSIQDTLATVMDQIGTIFIPQHWSLLLADPDNGCLTFEIAIGKDGEKLRGTTLSKGEGVAGWIATNQRPVIIEDVSTDPRFSDRMDSFTGFTTRSIIGVPLISGNKVFGVIELINKINGKLFTPYELKILTTIADFAAIAIEKAYYSNALKQLARTDPLTGLYNRGSFEHFLSSELASCKRYNRTMSMLMLDVDDFKAINDTFGHPAGDEVLKTLAMITKAAIRTVDKSCRYGGDEFIIILPNTSKLEVEQVKARIKDKIEYQNHLKTCPEFKVSIGQHVIAGDDNSAILSLLDDDLYHEKEKKEITDIHSLSANLSQSLSQERNLKK
ncbi:MAG: diguanylate cyclase (GGDEF)-like protein [Alteromonadaceae bacterium]|jgi:diguanylate cyclase (GGDEF)-like protein